MRKQTAEFLIIFILLVLSYVRYLFFLPTPPGIFYEIVDEKVVFSGMVSEYPDIRENQIRLIISPLDYDWKIIVPIYDQENIFRYGDVLKVSGTLSLPEKFDTDTGKVFDYKKYLLAQDIFFIIKNGNVEKIGEDGNKIKKILFLIREKFEDSIKKVLPVRDRGFVNGILLGAKGGISDKDEEAFIKTGTIHIVALSGFNVMIVAEAMFNLARSISYGIFAYIFSGTMIVLFVILSGASSTAIRAGTMALIALIARLFGRTYLALRALFIASLTMIVINPRIIFDISFHLSFIATFGVIVLPEKLLKYFKFVPEFFGFRKMVLTTASAILVVFPYILYKMGNLSIVSFITNILILPMIAPMMLFGFLSGAFGLISPFLALPFAYISHIGNSYIFSVVNFFANLPFSSITLKNFPLIILIVFYIWLLWWVFKANQTSQK